MLFTRTKNSLNEPEEFEEIDQKNGGMKAGIITEAFSTLGVFIGAIPYEPTGSCIGNFLSSLWFLGVRVGILACLLSTQSEYMIRLKIPN